MTTVNLVNPFWRGDAFTYWRFTPFDANTSPLLDFAWSELVMASTIGGANLLPSAVSVTAPGASNVPFIYDNGPDWAFGVATSSRIRDNTAYVQAQFASPVRVAQVRLTRQGSGADYTPRAWALAGSMDGVNWVGRGWYASTGYALNETKSFTIGAPADNNGRAGSRVWLWYNTRSLTGRQQIRELEFATSAGGPTLCSGGFGIARGTNSGAGSIAGAFDGNFTSTQWGSEADGRNAFLGYVFVTAPNPTHYRITSAAANFPTDWELYYLSNCADWVLADAQAGVSGWATNETRTYAIP